MDDIVITADFSDAKTEEEGEDLVLSGHLFQCGDYPDKAFSLTPAEMHGVIGAFVAPKPMDFEHWPSIFNGVNLAGAFGQIEKVWADQSEPDWLMASVRKPKWLHEVMPETRVSASFSRTLPGKPLLGAAWTDTPRVDGAELVAAFASKHSTSTGQFNLQMIHDASARGGAVCNRPASMASRHEATATQQIHDITVDHGATCEDASKSPTAMYSQKAGAASKPEHPTRRPRMTLRELLRKLGTDNGTEISEEEIEAEFSGPAKVQADALRTELSSRDQKIADLEKQYAARLTEIEEKSRADAAVAFSTAQVQAKRITPEGVTALTQLYVRLAQSDATATFADGEKSTVAILDEVFASLPDASLFTEGKVPAGTSVLSPATTTEVPGTAQPTREHLDGLLAMTDAGQAALAARSR